METPLVSINIPVYNCEAYILRCLESVKKQTYPAIETLLINDCTPDNSVAIIEDYLSKNPELNMRLIHHDKNQGLSIVRNRGIDESMGKYIYMLDSDDYITPDCIEKLVENSEKYSCEITVGETICLVAESNEKKQLFRNKSINNYVTENHIIFERFVNGDWPVIGPNKLYRRSFLNKNSIRFVRDLYSQDELFAFHCALKLVSISFIKDVTYIYYLHGESTIFNKKKVNFENHQTIVEWFGKSYKEARTLKRKRLIKRKLINFKDLTMQMQWKSMRDDIDYWKKNYSRLKKAPSLSVIDYCTNFFTRQEKKRNFYQNLPTSIGFKVFKKRYGS